MDFGNVTILLDKSTNLAINVILKKKKNLELAWPPKEKNWFFIVKYEIWNLNPPTQKIN